MSAPAFACRTVAVLCACIGAVLAQEPPPLAARELDQLLGPIALFPDALLAPLLAAATYPLDVAGLAQRLRDEAAAPPAAEVDGALAALAHYPDLVDLLDSSRDWTQQLGCCLLAQPADLFAAVQRLRQRAIALDNLIDSPEVRVLLDERFVRVVPADPAVIYVPIYEPGSVFAWRSWRPGSFVGFSIGRAAGPWLDLDCDWRGQRLQRPGWSWDRWREHLRLDGARVIGDADAAAVPWQRDATRPLPQVEPVLPVAEVVDAGRGREPEAPPPEPEPLPPWHRDRGRRHEWHAVVFDPRQSPTQLSRSAQRGVQSRGDRLLSPPVDDRPVRVPTPRIVVPPRPAASPPARPPLVGGGEAGRRGARSRAGR